MTLVPNLQQHQGTNALSTLQHLNIEELVKDASFKPDTENLSSPSPLHGTEAALFTN